MRNYKVVFTTTIGSELYLMKVVLGGVIQCAWVYHKCSNGTQGLKPSEGSLVHNMWIYPWIPGRKFLVDKDCDLLETTLLSNPHRKSVLPTHLHFFYYASTQVFWQQTELRSNLLHDGETYCSRKLTGERNQPLILLISCSIFFLSSLQYCHFLEHRKRQNWIKPMWIGSMKMGRTQKACRWWVL